MRKQRTRQHFIEDLGFNYIERQLLYSKCTLQRYQFDYGYDGLINTFNHIGEYENGVIQVQLKSTDSLKIVKNTIAFDLSKKDLELWLYSSSPVIIIIYDAQNELAYWVDLLIYFKENKEILKKVNKFVRIYIPNDNFFNKKAVQDIRNHKNSIYGDIKNI